MKTLRRYATTDTELLLLWRNHPETRRWSFSADPIPLDRHRAWFTRFLADPGRLGFILTENEQPLAQIRFEPVTSPGTFTISISVSPDHFGKGLGKEILRLAMEHPDVRQNAALARAETFTDNLPSQKIFLANGFVQVMRGQRDDREYLEWMKPLGDTLVKLPWAMVSGSQQNPELRICLESLHLRPLFSADDQDWDNLMRQAHQMKAHLLVLCGVRDQLPEKVVRAFPGGVVYFATQADGMTAVEYSDLVTVLRPGVLSVSSIGRLLETMAHLARKENHDLPMGG